MDKEEERDLLIFLSYIFICGFLLKGYDVSLPLTVLFYYVFNEIFKKQRSSP